MRRRRSSKATTVGCQSATENSSDEMNSVSCKLKFDSIFEIKENDIMGRYLIAKKDIEAGTILMKEEPLIVGPNQGCSPMCIACYAPIDIAVCTRCPSCLWPLCRVNCEGVDKANGHSTEECKILQRSKETPTPENTFLYNALSPIRVLLLKLSNDKQWEILSSMKSRNKCREETEQWRMENKLLEFIKKCITVEVSDELIHTIFGYLQVNSFTVEGKAVSVLYPKAYLLSHDCAPNTSHVIDQKYCLTLRTKTKVKKGEPLTLSYCNTLNGTSWRRMQLRQSKYFDCTCKRCKDRSELKTYMSAVKCEKCKKGYILPKEPLDYNSDWVCNKCTNTQPWEKIYNLINSISDELEKIIKDDIPVAEKFIEKYQDKLHPHHFLLTSSKFKLSQMYGKLPDYMIHAMNKEQLQRKRELCKDILEVFNKIEPGFSRIRGVTLYELHAPTLLLGSLEYNMTKNNKKFQNDLKEVISYLREVSQILSIEDQASPEGLLGKAATKALQQMKM